MYKLLKKIFLTKEINKTFDQFLFEQLLLIITNNEKLLKYKMLDYSYGSTVKLYY